MHQVVENLRAGGTQVPPALRVSSYTKRYGAHLAAYEISLEVGAGELHGLLGANGSGKSSLIHGVAGVIAPDDGDIEICGQPGSSRLGKQQLAYIPDDLPLPESLSGNEFLDFHDRLGGREHSGWRDSLVELFNIAPHLGKFVGEMSHGTKKKLQVTAALSGVARLIILDEPYRGLDVESCQTLTSLLRTHCRRGGGVLLATHDLDFADRECSNVTILSEGRIAATGSPLGLRDKYERNSLSSVFLHLSGLKDKSLDTSVRIERDWPSSPWGTTS